MSDPAADLLTGDNVVALSFRPDRQNPRRAVAERCGYTLERVMWAAFRFPKRNEDMALSATVSR